MGRRKGMWITIICILVVGVSVTRMTRSLVASGETEMQAYSADAEIPAAEQHAAPMEAPQDGASMKQSLSVSPAAEPAAGEASAVPRAGTEAQAGSFSVSAAPSSVSEAPVFEADAVSEDSADSPAPGAQSLTAGDGESGKATDETVPETVKSPLDPAVETEASALVIAESREEPSYTLDELKERLSIAEEKAAESRNGALDGGPGSVYAAAEQERVLWDRELNIIYTAIRGEMTPEEAEELKRSELEWLKERDLAAEKATVKGGAVQNQSPNPDSVRVLAEKTRERCYELISDYEDLLTKE